MARKATAKATPQHQQYLAQCRERLAAYLEAARIARAMAQK